MERRSLNSSMMSQSMNQKEVTGPIHEGYECDSCHVCPIVGVRYMSSTKEDYDLC